MGQELNVNIDPSIWQAVEALFGEWQVVFPARVAARAGVSEQEARDALVLLSAGPDRVLVEFLMTCNFANGENPINERYYIQARPQTH